MKRIAGAPSTAAKAAALTEIQTDPSFSAAVVAWQRRHGRHALPWQNTRDAYRIWLSEIMLQQTQVAAVIPYYQRFLLRFPDVAALAAAPVEDVMALWSGLGYYSRARNLHRCARRICEDFSGIFPSDPSVLAELPGIGRSTAAAIAAFAYGSRAAIMDGNVKRVFCRVFGVDGFPGEKAVETLLWQRAEALLPAGGMAADGTSDARPDIVSYTQGLMDLGATVCTRSRPFCPTCPLASRCVALASGRVQELPVRKAKKAVPEKHTVMLVVVDGAKVLLEQRPDSGIWGGLLSLPEVDHFADAATTDPERRNAILGMAIGSVATVASSEPLQPFSHAFTHYKLHVTPYLVRVDRRIESAAQKGYVWQAADRLAHAPLPAPVKKLLLALFAGQGDLFEAAV